MSLGSLRWLRGNAVALIDRELTRMREAFRKKYPDGSLLSYTLTKETLSTVLSELSPSLFADSAKFIVLRVEKTKKRSRASLDDEGADDLPEEASSLSAEDVHLLRQGMEWATENVHVMISWEGGYPGKKDLTALSLEGLITWKDFPFPTKAQIIQSLRSRINIDPIDEQTLLSRYTLLSESDLARVKPRDLSMVTTRVNESLRQLEKDIDTLSLLSPGHDAFVEHADIVALTGLSSGGENIFAVIDGLIDGSKNVSQLIRSELLVSSPFAVLANLLSNFRTQVYLQMLYERGFSAARAADALAVHTFVAEKSYARRSASSHIQRVYRALIELDQGVKTGGLIGTKSEEALAAELEMLSCLPFVARSYSSS